jgi:type I restriction enzyme S subunit
MQKLQLKKEYQKYLEYKDSGVEWIGEIPKNIGLRKFRHFATYTKGRNPKELFDEQGSDRLPYLSMDYLRGKYNSISYANPNGYVLVEEGEMLLLWDGSNAGEFMRSKKGVLSSTMSLIDAECGMDKNFLGYLFKSFEKKLKDLTIGMGIPHVNGSVLKEASFPIFSIKDQQKIAKFLDEKVELIDEIVKKKKKLIELLKEKRTAVINQLVNLESSDSLQRLKFSIETNPSKQVLKVLPNDYLVSFLPMEKVSSKGELNLEDERKLEMVTEGFTYFKDEDVIFAKITPCFENGKGAMVNNLKNGIGFGSTEFIVLRANKDMHPRYIYYLVSSHKFRKIGEVEMRGSAGQKRVPESFVRNYIFNKISRKEQEKIANNLDGKTDAFDNIIKKAKQSINLLNEFKSSLISNVVTGKVRV